MPTLKRLNDLVRCELNNDNLHRIAIHNLRDTARQIERWWARKYRQPIRPFEAHTLEELVIEMLEDWYEKHPAEAERFLESSSADHAWDGRMSDEHEREMQARWAKKPKVDLDRFKDEKELTPEEEQAILDNLGRNLPKSKMMRNQPIEGLKSGSSDPAFIGGDFDDDFGV